MHFISVLENIKIYIKIYIKIVPTWFLVNDQRDAQILFYVFISIYNSLNVSSTSRSSSGETNCIKCYYMFRSTTVVRELTYEPS
jgi:hypothetical protein